MKKRSNPPTLKGFNSYSDFEIQECVKNNGLLSLWIEPSLYCNYKCLYCYTYSNNTSKGEGIPFDKLTAIISESSNLGLKSIILVGGEPLLYPDLDKIITTAKNSEITTVIFTNGYSINKQKAKFFFENDCSVLLKYESFKDHIQDGITGVSGSLKVIKQSLENLQQFKFNSDSDVLRLGISTVISKINLEEISILWKFCRDNNLFPHFEPVGCEGRAKKIYKKIGISSTNTRKVYDNLLAIDESEYGYTWDRFYALPAFDCKQLLYSANLMANGTVTVCNGVAFPLGNINKQTLKEVLNSDPVGRYRKCYKSGNYGCRARAYNLKGDLFATDPIWEV